MFWHNVLKSIFNVITMALWGFAQMVINIANAFIDLYNFIRIRKSKELGYLSNPFGENPPGLTDGWIDIGDLTSAGSEAGGSYGGSGLTGSSSTVVRAPDIYIYQTYEGPVVGAGGVAEVGRFMAESLLEYANIGGYNIILQEAG